MTQQHTLGAQVARTDAAMRTRTRDAELIALRAMTPAQRLAAFHRDELSLAHMRAPHEDPAASTCDHREWPWLLRVCADDLGDDPEGARR